MSIRVSFPAPTAPHLTTPPRAFADKHLRTRPVAGEHQLLRATVQEVTAPARNLLRITVHSAALSDYQLSGPDEFFGLIMPPPGRALQLPEHPQGENLRATIADMPPETRPDLRWYTARLFDPDAGTLTFDVATHGKRRVNLATDTTGATTNDLGPGLRWSLRAQPGDEVGLWTTQGLWHQAARHQTFIADPSSLPSVRAILDFTATFNPSQLGNMHVLALRESEEDIEPGLQEWSDQLGSLHVFECPAANFATATAQYLTDLDRRAHPATQADYVWVAGEGGLCKTVRRHCIHSWGLNPTDVQWCPYWFMGRPRP